MIFKKQIFGDAFVNKHVAEIMGQRYHSRPYAWVGGGCAYSHITGGIALPTFEYPGFLLTIAVKHKDNVFVCMNEFESEDEYELIEKAQDIQTEYGQGVISNWWGNPEDLMSLVNEKNIDGNQVFISDPIDSNQTDAFQLFTARLRTALRQHHKTLYLGKCNLLRNHILSFVQDKTAKATNNPAIFVAGSLIHTLLMTRPWEQAIEKTELIPTSHEDFAAYAHKKEMERLEHELYGDIVA